MMCGLFGSLASYVERDKLVDELAKANTVRGNRGFGIVRWSPMHCEVIRHIGPWQHDHLEPAPVILGHVRAPTGGEDGLQSTHPFETPEFLLAHNGILLNADNIAPSMAYSGNPVDSMALVHGIDRALRSGSSVPDAIAGTAASLDGQQACWLWHKREAALYLWRVMSTLFWAESDRSRFVFSSVSYGPANKPVDQGKVFRITPDVPRPVVVADFEFYSPYME